MEFDSDIQRQIDVWWTEQEINEIVDPGFQGDKDIQRVRRDTLSNAVQNEMDEQLWNDEVRTVLRELADYSNRKGGVCLLGGQVGLAAQERFYSNPYGSVDAVKRALVERFGYPVWEGNGPEIGTEERISAIARLVKASPISAIWGESDLEMIEKEVESYYWEHEERWEKKRQKRLSTETR